MKQSQKTVLLWLLLLFMFLGVWQFMNPPQSRQIVAFSEFVSDVQAGHVEEVRIKDRKYT